MEPTFNAAVCLICFEMTENNICVPSDAPPKLLSNCNTYLHSTITKETLKHIQLNHENQLVICKSCFDFALELTQLSEQLTTIQKNISDLTVAFSMAVFHRRSQVYSRSQIQNNFQSLNSSSIIEFNEACMPPNLFSNKIKNPNINPDDRDIPFNSMNTPTTTNFSNEKFNNFQSDNLSGHSQPLITKDDTVILAEFGEVNLDENLIQPTIERNRNLAIVNEMGFVHAADGNNSKNDEDLNNGMQLTISKVTSVHIPVITSERINTKGHDSETDVENSFQTNSEPIQNIMDETPIKDVEFSDTSCAPNSLQGEGILKCFYCEKTFAEASDRNIHHRTHVGDQPYKCLYCEKRFHDQANCRSHERTHTIQKPHKCSYCTKYFYSLSSLKTHQTIHIGENPYKCPFCEKRFPKSSDLKSHELSHILNQSLKCSFCEKRFSTQAILKTHEMTHTVTDEEAPYKCSVCEKRFSKKDAHISHEITHSIEKRFKCSVCEKKFTWWALKIHEKSHIGETNNKTHMYKCLYCEETFKRVTHRNNHQKTHQEKSLLITPLCDPTGNSLSHLNQYEITNSTTQSNFKCSFCKITFRQDVDRIIHERIHRKKDGIHTIKEETVDEDFIVGI